MECSELKNESIIKDRKISDLERKMKENNSDYINKVNLEIKDK